MGAPASSIDAGDEAIAIALADEAATARFAARIAALARPGDVIALWGDLGAGKTTFARGFLRALGHAGEVPSPTFTLVQSYPLARATVCHIDLYRLGAPEEAWELGLEDAFAEAISLIEWPDRLGALLPEDRLDIHFADDGAGRVARLRGHGAWRARLAALAADD